jgi:peptidoglycan hydrolase CwlO-like protein
MKKAAVLIMAVFMMSATAPAFAAEMTKAQKDECLLASKGCMTEVDSLQKRVHKLQAEIKKGKKVYSAEELKKLDQKLKEANELINSIEKGP